MKFAASVLLLSALQFAEAHIDKDLHARHVKRQVTTADAATTSGSSTIVATASGSATGTATGSTTTATVTSTGAPAQATYTTIPPIESITFGMPTRAITAFVGTHTPGETPPISGAPALPSTLALVGWPAQDKIPPTDSPQVKEWLKELEGFDIPDLAPTKDSTCAGDPSAAADAAARGWWTCGGHTRSTDIVSCPTKFDWGMSFDDGPSPQTPTLLTKLKEENLHATFFVVGSRVIERPALVIEEYMSGHEISVHTWSHNTLTKLTNEQIVAELGWTRKAIRDAIGVTPTTMRPPQGDIDDRVRAISMAMGMIPIIWTSTPDGGKFDSNDWRVAGGLLTGVQAVDTFKTILSNGTALDTGFISLQHDLFEITVDIAVGYTIDLALTHEPKFNLQSIGECLNYPAGNLYRETTANATFPYTNLTAGGLDVDGDGTIDIKTTASTSKSAGFVVSISIRLAVAVAALGLLGQL
ncbi:carbohydrate esterase family 4 protein [Hypholoma sublateritium FD-334 SS-4]|uniref:chitin deacetylase n=1 Tax=Hypholoma sublateritium (strain FD-334 SS-4) TaxID=945553 RepID=A0A0D2PHX9_HYPSF|nr:carbohydrate esterase family 4 protein [Hypholoma sublateritium FD-334 SS-4]